MNKSLLISLSSLGMMLLLTSSVLQAQNVGIGTNNPHPKALVHLEDSTRGLLPTRMTTAQRDTLTNKPEGLVIYNVTTHCLEFWNGSKWISTCASTVPCTKPPKPVPTPKDTVYWCLGQNGQLCVNSISGLSYIWIGPNGFNTTGACVTVPNVNSSSFGTYTVYAYNPITNCSSEGTDVVVLQKPTICTSSNTWNALPTPPAAISFRGAHIIVSHLGYVYLGFGDIGGSGCVYNWWRWNPCSNTWKQLANPPVNFGGLPFTFTIGNYIYVGGGQYLCGGPTNSFYRYDPANNSWSPMAPFPISIHSAAGTSDGTYGYVACGYNGSTGLNTLYRYDPSANSWSLLPTSVPGPNRWSTFLAYYQGSLYIGGGNAAGTCIQNFYSYDIASNTWTTLANPPNAQYEGCAVAYNGRIYVTGEHISPTCGSCTNQFYYYDIATNTWQPMAIFPGGVRNDLRLVELNGVLYGGFGHGCNTHIRDWWAYCP
jgi:N-acetylneuraminic acid mutarotase